MSTEVTPEQAQVVHDSLVRLLNLNPAQVRAGAFSIGWCEDDDVVQVTWDGQARVPASAWGRIVRETGITPTPK